MKILRIYLEAKALRDKALNIAKNPKHNGYHEV